jgi:hypothetical protein
VIARVGKHVAKARWISMTDRRVRRKPNPDSSSEATTIEDGVLAGDCALRVAADAIEHRAVERQCMGNVLLGQERSDRQEG